ncbi:3-oxoacyl-[acyl-carrier protein] reductase [Antricoccus suffuscus]|uniref:3-oxoacyl-[acyl-carrier protein] reductase n=1 Tax=Antricoccus suffuscus TaxID=1629062 RepID=A0A2T1A0V4_9ACTN|nr:3-oxoacyl-ACP reductase FabG [Antricoccus suffuscus]PRZ42240.1 3-oxoacyl-[acyl-carrier protein] reductase [Antricoccus suffuscus]
MGKLEGRVAVVTGAGQGIGLAVAKAYVAEGAKVAMVDKRPEIVDIAAELGEGFRGYVCDVSQRADVESLAHDVQLDLGPIGVLVNNAGITRPAMLWKMTDEQWDSVINVHLKGTWLCTQTVIPQMREAGWGRIINVTSSAGINGTIGQANYASAKGGILALTRSAARELAGFGIIVNAIAPAAATPMTEKIRTDERFVETYLERMMIKRWAEPEEIAPTFVFLASEDTSYMTGQVLSVDGGSVVVR